MPFFHSFRCETKILTLPSSLRSLQQALGGPARICGPNNWRNDCCYSRDDIQSAWLRVPDPRLHPVHIRSFHLSGVRSFLLLQVVVAHRVLMQGLFIAHTSHHFDSVRGKIYVGRMGWCTHCVAHDARWHTCLLHCNP